MKWQWCHLVKGIDKPIVWLFDVLKVKLRVDDLDLKDDDQNFNQKDGDLVPNVGDPGARHKCQEDSVGDHVSKPEVNMGPEKLWLIV